MKIISTEQLVFEVLKDKTTCTFSDLFTKKMKLEEKNDLFVDYNMQNLINFVSRYSICFYINYDNNMLIKTDLNLFENLKKFFEINV